MVLVCEQCCLAGKQRAVVHIALEIVVFSFGSKMVSRMVSVFFFFFSNKQE